MSSTRVPPRSPDPIDDDEDDAITVPMRRSALPWTVPRPPDSCAPLELSAIDGEHTEDTVIIRRARRSDLRCLWIFAGALPVIASVVLTRALDESQPTLASLPTIASVAPLEPATDRHAPVTLESSIARERSGVDGGLRWDGTNDAAPSPAGDDPRAREVRDVTPRLRSGARAPRHRRFVLE